MLRPLRYIVFLTARARVHSMRLKFSGVTIHGAHAQPIESRPKQILTEIQHLLARDLAATNRLILEQLTSEIEIIQTIAQHIINSGGKRLRPF